MPDSLARPEELKPSQQQAQAAYVTAHLLTRYHYKAMPLDDAMSEKIFDQYLKLLDPEKLFFVQADIAQLSGFRTELDDAIINEDLSAPFVIFNLHAQRLSERFSYARSLLAGGFDFRRKESYRYDRRKDPWPKSEPELRELWRKRVKSDWLRLKLAGKNDQSIAETLDKRYDNHMKRIARMKSEEVFQTFMNAYTTAIEPHTNYMGARAAADFDVSARLSLVGIGATLAERNDYATIRELKAGGPAAMSGQLKIGDRIVGVAQGENGAMTDVRGWRLDDIVALIRGTADSAVRLDVLPADDIPDDRHKQVSLIRKKITLEEQAAKKSTIAVADGGTTRRIGVISLPSFYQDFEARRQGDLNFKSATHDVARLLTELKEEKVDGVLIDLRNNGGGSLSEAVELTGLFIDKGPVVQQRDARGKITVAEDTNAGTAWDGPLGVLVNRNSASASEIFAAAIQDYRRGLIVGEPSFGKGTVQTVVNLNQVVIDKDEPALGELKLTVAQFFRVTGGTTQLRGVTPDIAVPSIPAGFDTETLGESSFDNALPWEQVKAANFSPAHDDLKSLLPALLPRHEARVKADKDFQLLLKNIAESRLQRRKNQISLNETERRKARATREDADARSADKEARGILQDDGLQADERNLANELAIENARKNASDVLLNEAAHILSDEAGLLTGSARLTTRTAIPPPRSSIDFCASAGTGNVPASACSSARLGA